MKYLGLLLLYSGLLFILVACYRVQTELTVKLNLPTRILYWLNLAAIVARTLLLTLVLIKTEFGSSALEEGVLWLVNLAFFGFYWSLMSRVCLAATLKKCLRGGDPNRLMSSELFLTD